MTSIFIPTKNRLDKPKTYQILKDLGLKPILVLDPQEEQEAKKLGFNYIALPLNDQGLTYSRNYILDYCRNNNIVNAVMIDDDVNCFGRIIEKRFIKDNKAFLDALKIFEKTQTCGTMEYAQFGWASPKSMSINKSIEVVHFLYIPKMKNVSYEYDTKEDKDLAIQLIFKGVDIFKCNHLCFQVPSIGTNKGGLHELYAQNRDNKWAENLYNKWGSNIVKLVKKKNGRIDVQIRWNKIRNEL